MLMRAIATGSWMPGWLRSTATKRDRTMVTTTIPSPFRVTICGIPELGEHCAAGVTHVLSILDPDHPDPVAFAAFAPHHRLALRFNDIIEPEFDRLAPTHADVERMLDFTCALGEMADFSSADSLPCRRVALDRIGGIDPGTGGADPSGEGHLCGNREHTAARLAKPADA